jgi:hypothetical protein
MIVNLGLFNSSLSDSWVLSVTMALFPSLEREGNYGILGFLLLYFDWGLELIGI